MNCWVSCMLFNTSDEITPGPTNTVQVDCSAPNGSGTSENAVINVTGPSGDWRPSPADRPAVP